MKILMTADAVGGVWTYAVDLARALANGHIDVAIATMGPRPSSAQHAQIDSLSGVALYESDYRLEWMDDPWTDVDRAGEWLLDLESKLHPDVIHLNGYTHAALPWKAPKLVVAHSCVLSWWLTVKGEAAPDRIWREYGERVRTGLSAADCVAAPTRAMLDSIRLLYGECRRMCVVPNGRDVGRPCIENKEAFIVSAGRLWDQAKNVAALDRISSALAWPVFLAGDSEPPDRAADARAEYANVCRALGKLSPESFGEVLQRASIFCLPARYEPFGLTVLEAAQAGCALVLGDIPSLRENWDGAALFVDPNDDVRLAEMLNDLIHDPAKRSDFASRARKRAGRFTVPAMVARYVEIYSTLLNRAAPFAADGVTACAS